MKLHVESVHERKKTFKCDICDYVLFARSASEYCAFKKCSTSFLFVELDISKGSELALSKIITF